MNINRSYTYKCVCVCEMIDFCVYTCIYKHVLYRYIHEHIHIYIWYTPLAISSSQDIPQPESPACAPLGWLVSVTACVHSSINVRVFMCGPAASCLVTGLFP